MTDANEDIKIDYDDAVDNYEKEQVDSAIETFVEENYEIIKQAFNHCYETKNYKELHRQAHTFRTTAKYMGSEGFSNLCTELEKCVKTGSIDVDKLDKLYPSFMVRFADFYVIAKYQYNIIKNIPNEPPVKPFQIPNDDDSSNNKIDIDDSKKDSSNCFASPNPSNSVVSSPYFPNGKTNEKLNTTSLSSGRETKVNQRKFIVRYDIACEKFGEKLFLLSGRMILKNECEVSADDIKKQYIVKDIKEIKRIIVTLKVLSVYLCADDFVSYCEMIESFLKSSPEELLNQKDQFLSQYEIFFQELLLHSDKINAFALINQPLKTHKRFTKQLQRSSTISLLKDKPLMQKNTSNTPLFADLTPQVHLLIGENIDKIEDLGNNLVINNNKGKNSFFAIDRSLIKIKGIIDGRREKYDYQKEISNLSFLFVLSIENEDKCLIILALTLLKEISIDFNFEAMQACISEWISEIQAKPSLSFFQLDSDDIDNVLRGMTKEIKDSLLQDINKAQSLARKIADSPQSSGGVFIKVDDKNLEELKIVDVSDFFKMTLTKEEIEKEINALNQSSNANPKMLGKKLLSKQKTINPLVDCNYPFKEEAFSCIII